MSMFIKKTINVIRFLFLILVKSSSKLLYSTDYKWISSKPKDWKDISLVVILNHTSLFEFIYCSALPNNYLWEISNRLILPVADKTMKKRFYGFFFRHLAPKCITLTRKRDESWRHFINSIEHDDICIFMPEGRMKRVNGLDVQGKKMTVRTGIYDLLLKYRQNKALFVYSKGLHKILPPGKIVPNIFQRVQANLEVIELNQYLENFSQFDKPWQKIAQDLESRRDRYSAL